MSRLSNSAYILNLLCITLLEWKNKEYLNNCLQNISPGFTGLKPLDGFMCISIKWVPGAPKELVDNSKLSPWNRCKKLRHFNSIYWQLP